MLEFADLPYQFVPPKPNWLIISLVRTVNRLIAIPGKNHRLTGIDLGGMENFLEAKRQEGARFVFMPNHPSHSDPHVLMEICRRARVRPAFMTAYDVFARGKFGAWIMQRTGAFSVDREGSDRKSMKCAAEILKAGKYPLVIFPEGNVYLCNDRVTPYNEGAAYIALRAQKAIGDEAPVFIVPVALKYSYVEDVREPIRDAMSEIAAMFKTEFDRDASIRDEVKRISITALSRFLKQRGYIPPADANSLADEQIAHAAEQIIDGLEAKMELRPRPTDTFTGRVRKIRAAIHAIRTDPDRTVDHPAASHWADEAILALRILGYEGGYAAATPTLDRIAETVVRLREDVTSLCHPPDGKRRVLAEIEKPIDLRDYLDAFRSKARGTIGVVTDACEATTQAAIDRMNAANTLPGAESF